MRSRSVRSSGPWSTPEGPVMTKTRDTRGRSRLAPEHRDELAALALGEAADGLARGDAALLQHLVGLHAPVLGDREEHVEDLRGLDVLGRVQQQSVDGRATPLEVLLQLRATGADRVGALERVHPLVQRAFWRGRG